MFTPTFRETFGLTIIEADACYLPVITRDLDVFRELFGKNISYGKTVDVFSTIIQEKPKKTKGTLAKKYDLNRVADDAISLYEQIISSKK